jgi:hypothetical protein
MGVGLALVRHQDNVEFLGLVLVGIGALVGMGAIAWHCYQHHRSKTLRTLGHLLEEVDRHNSIIQALNVMQNLESAKASKSQSPPRPDIIQALRATHESLVSGLATDKILRQHHIAVTIYPMLALSWVHWLVILSALISIFGASFYIRDTLVGKTKPNRITWSMWATAPLIGTAAAVASGADFWAIVRVFLAGFMPLLIFLASFINRRSYWRLNKFDLGCGALSVAALIVWAAADSPRSAILLAAAGDGFAAIPTFTKAWKFPETETGAMFIGSFLSSVLVMPSIPQWNIENAAFTIYLCCASGLLLFAIYRKHLGFDRL